MEFILAKGETVAVLTLESDDLRPRGGEEILHTRLARHSTWPVSSTAALHQCRAELARLVADPPSRDTGRCRP